MKGRFFKKQNDSSSSEDSSEEDTKQIQEQQEKKEEVKPDPKAPVGKKAGKPQLYGDSSSESEDEQRVVKTTMEKRTETLEKIFKQTKAHTKNNDFGSLLTDFEQIQEEMDKCVGSVFATDKFQTLPIWVLKNLLEINDCVNDITPEQKKKMSKGNSQAFTKLRQKFKKYLESHGDDENRFQAQLEEYKKNPQDDQPEKKKKKKDDSDSDDDSDDDDDDDSDEDDDDDDDSESEEEQKKPVKKQEEKKKIDNKKDDSDSSDDDSSSEDDDSDDNKVKTKKGADKKKDQSGSSSSDSDSDSSSSSTDQNEVKSEISDNVSENIDQNELPKHLQFLKLHHQEKQPHERRWKWVKYDKLPEDMKRFIKPPGGKDPTEVKQHKIKPAHDKVKEIDDPEKIILKPWELDFTVKENVDRILGEYTTAQNSRKNFLPQEQIKTLEVMEKVLKGNPDKMIDILMLLIKANLTYSKNMPNGYLIREVWITICQKINEFIDILENQMKLKNNEDASKNQEEVDDFDKYDRKMKDQLVSLTLVDILEKLDKQLFQAFQSLDQSQIEYLYRLKDECSLLKLIDKMMSFFEKSNDKDKVARISLTKLEHIYYKNDLLYEQTKTLLKSKPEKKNEIYFMDQPSRQIVQDLVSKVTKNYGKKEKIRAILLQIYHHAIHNRVREAKDLMMRGQFTQIINKQPKINRIHYNRALIQIGLALFRLGRFDEANVLLMEVCQTPRLRESLAQSNKHFEDDTDERKLQRPSHLHINLETLECVYMTTSMFLEIPNISANKFTIQKNVISKNFRKLIDQYDQKGIQFLPQSGRDYIVFAARELHKSHWEQSFANLCKIQVFQRMNEFKEGKLKAALLKKVQETSLKIYIIENQNCLESMKMDQTEGFNMSRAETLKLTSYLIHKQIVNAQICADTDTLQFKVHDELKKGETTVGTLPQNDRKEVEFLQQKHLEQIKVMVTANDRFMDLFVNQSYHQFQPQHQYHERGRR